MHIDLCCIFGERLNFMFNQVGCEVSELDGGSIQLIGSVEQVYELLDEVFSVSDRWAVPFVLLSLS